MLTPTHAETAGTEIAVDSAIDGWCLPNQRIRLSNCSDGVGKGSSRCQLSKLVEGTIAFSNLSVGCCRRKMWLSRERRRTACASHLPILCSTRRVRRTVSASICQRPHRGQSKVLQSGSIPSWDCARLEQIGHSGMFSAPAPKRICEIYPMRADRVSSIMQTATGRGLSCRPLEAFRPARRADRASAA